MQEPDPSCQGFVLTVAPSFVSIPGDVISVNSVSCGISIRPRLLKQMSPSQGSISFSHLIIRIESGSISRSQSDHRDAPNPWIGTTIPQSILTLHMKVVKESWLFCGNEGSVSVFQIFTDAVSLGEIYWLRQDEWFTRTVTVFSMRGNMPKTIKIIRNGRHFYTRLTWQKYCSLAC